jgi:pantothenate synthetase
VVVFDKQLVQFVEVMEQVLQGESQLTHRPFLMTSGLGHVFTQLPLFKAVFGAHDVQFVAIIEHVAHTAAHASHVLVASLLTVTLTGHETIHVVP